MKYTDEALDTWRAYDLSAGMEVQVRCKGYSGNLIVDNFTVETITPTLVRLNSTSCWVYMNEVYPIDYEADEDENSISCGATCVECGTMNEYQPARAGYVCGLCKGRRAMWC